MRKRYFFEIITGGHFHSDMDGMVHASAASAVDYGTRIINELGSEIEYRDVVVIVSDPKKRLVAVLDWQSHGADSWQSHNPKTAENAC